MAKFEAMIKVVIKAETRHEAWEIGAAICRKHLRDVATVWAVSQSLPDPDDWIAINEPIKAKR